MTKVLKIFKQLHRTKAQVFEGDYLALEQARQKINNEFRKNSFVKNETTIKELISYANEVEKELRTSVVQAKEVKPGYYQLKLRPEVKKLDNVPFQECPR